MKNIYNIGENLSLESGGQRTAISNLHNYINSSNAGLVSTIVTNLKELDDDYICFELKKNSFWCYNSKMKEFLKNNINQSSILHLNGAWMYTQYISSKIAINSGAPYVMTLHGMINPWYLNQKKLKKKIYLDLLLKNILKNSNVIHAITPFEKESIFKLTNHKNIIEIPNFINFSEIPTTFDYNPDEEYLLFLSRLHQGKGLDILIKAMSKIENKKIKLKIAGTRNEYSIILEKKIQELGLNNRVSFIGSVFGEEKYKLFANAKAFIAPSYSEAIGMVNLEAASCRTPVITTFNTGINPMWNHNGGLMINPNVEELIKAINEVNSYSIEERRNRGNSLSEFVLENYSWEKKGGMWIDLYNSLK